MPLRTTRPRPYRTLSNVQVPADGAPPADRAFRGAAAPASHGLGPLQDLRRSLLEPPASSATATRDDNRPENVSAVA